MTWEVFKNEDHYHIHKTGQIIYKQIFEHNIWPALAAIAGQL